MATITTVKNQWDVGSDKCGGLCALSFIQSSSCNESISS